MSDSTGNNIGEFFAVHEHGHGELSRDHFALLATTQVMVCCLDCGEIQTADEIDAGNCRPLPEDTDKVVLK